MRLGSILAIAALGGSAWLDGCKKPGAAGGASTNSPPATNVYVHLNHAQPKLPVIKLWVGAQELQTEVAISFTEVATGMMFREKMEENEAMLFVFGTPKKREFYMENCKVALSAAYIDPVGKILEIVPLQPGVKKPVPSQSDGVQYVLETKQGWFERHEVTPGSVIRTERGTLAQSFAGQRVLH